MFTAQKTAEAAMKWEKVFANVTELVKKYKHYPKLINKWADGLGRLTLKAEKQMHRRAEKVFPHPYPQSYCDLTFC